MSLDDPSNDGFYMPHHAVIIKRTYVVVLIFLLIAINIAMFFLENCLLSLIRRFKNITYDIYLIVLNFYYRCDYLSV